MSNNWEETFTSWAKPPGETEQTKSDNAERAIRKAINANSVLNNRSITVFPQGSYRNRTNVRIESDVDICALCTDSFFFDLPDRMTPDDFNISTPANYLYSDYKNDIENALVDYLGRNAVKRGNKAFDVHETTYRVDADVVACFEHRRYQRDGTYLEGAAFHTDQGRRIVNWPNQNYDNGVTKNSETGHRFKAIVRILKRLRNKMEDDRITLAKPVSSYLIECLVWNVPNEGFGHNTYMADVRWVLAHLFNNTRNVDSCKEWGEINELEYLFRTFQPWTREQANSFLSAAWNYIGFE
jgi:hypothetical protein